MNPSGGWHHSRRDRAAGFCVFNDIGVAIEYLFSHGLAGRVYYIDTDAHHGTILFGRKIYIYSVSNGYIIFIYYKVGKKGVGNRWLRDVDEVWVFSFS